MKDKEPSGQPGGFFMRRSVQRKYAAGAANGSLSERGKTALPCLILCRQ